MSSEAIFAYKFPLSLVKKLSGALSSLEAQPNTGKTHLKRIKTTRFKNKVLKNARKRADQGLKSNSRMPETDWKPKWARRPFFAYKFPLSLVIKLSGALSGLEAQPDIGRAHLKRVKTPVSYTHLTLPTILRV